MGKRRLKKEESTHHADLYEMVEAIRGSDISVADYASAYGFIAQNDLSGSGIEVQIIDTSK